MDVKTSFDTFYLFAGLDEVVMVSHDLDKIVLFFRITANSKIDQDTIAYQQKIHNLPLRLDVIKIYEAAKIHVKKPYQKNVAKRLDRFFWD